jgi:hypothetical protein
MASITVTAPDARTRPGWRRHAATARTALTKGMRQGAQVASAARHRYRRPALVISSFGCIDASAWTTFGTGAGLLAIGISLFVLEMLGGDE